MPLDFQKQLNTLKFNSSEKEFDLKTSSYHLFILCIENVGTMRMQFGYTPLWISGYNKLIQKKKS